MQVVPRRTAAPAPAPYAASDAVYGDVKAYLSSREALQMSESDLERELNRRGQELLRKLLQGHLDQRSPGEAAGPVEGADGVERSERRLHDRRLETTFGTVSVERLGYAHPGHDSLHPLDASPRSLQGPAVSAICRLIGRLIGRWGRLTRAWVQMDTDGALRLNRSSQSCLNSLNSRA